MARRYLIVGLGAAGLAAAETIRGLDAAGEILLVSDDPHGYYSRPGLAYYLTGELAESWLAPFSEADFRQLDLRRLHARIGPHEAAERPAEDRDAAPFAGSATTEAGTSLPGFSSESSASSAVRSTSSIHAVWSLSRSASSPSTASRHSS